MTTLIGPSLTLDEAIRKSYYLKRDTFIWRIREDIFASTFSEEFSFNSIGVTWKRNSNSYTCYLAADVLPFDADNNTIFVGLSSNNGHFDSLDELRKAFPKLFSVKGEFRALLTLL